MKYFGREDNVAVAVSLGEIFLDNILDVAKIRESLDILSDEHLGLHDVNDLFHPEIQFPPVLLRRDFFWKLSSVMRCYRIETQPFPSDTEILAGKPSSDDIYILREYFLTRMVALDKIDYALKMVDGRIFPESAHVLVPCQIGLFKNVVGKDCREPVFLKKHPVLLNSTLNPL